MYLSDFSSGMLSQARQNLAGSSFQFAVINAQSIPLRTASLDAVIANNMLYHIPDLPAALSEVRRVLNPGGRFFAATNGNDHLHELLGLPKRLDSVRAVEVINRAQRGFSLENGAAQLRQDFSTVRMEIYPDSLHVTEPDPLVDYILTTFDFCDLENVRPQLRTLILSEMDQAGDVLKITKSSGIFIGTV
jgi:SAM-dependent methyltransferase